MSENATSPGPPHRATDPRRREAVVAGYEGPSELVEEAAGDPDPSVRAAALGALQRRRALSVSTLAEALGDPSPLVRRRAAELAARQLRRGPLEAALRAALSDPDPLVVDAACFALGERRARGSVGALAEVVGSHADARCREAAVAALGAIGEERSLDSVLGALSDRPAVRRRAVVALAAFRGPEVEAALRRCLEDRDWQVRQAAEELLG